MEEATSVTAPETTGFLYELGQRVFLLSGENGWVIGRAEYSEAVDSYLIRYKSADGRLVEDWWSECVIVPPEELERDAFQAAEQAT